MPEHDWSEGADFVVEVYEKLVAAAEAVEPLPRGLSAPQIGEWCRLIIVRHDGDWRAFVNPVITYGSKPRRVEREGCLSVPGVYENVARHLSVSLRYEDLTGTPLRGGFGQSTARTIQHEIDHLDGRLIIDYRSR